MDFSNYKDATITRQIMRRMAAMQIPSLEAYGEYIGKRRQELNELASNFLICVTSFFRDPESFDALRKELRELKKRTRLLEQENEVLRRAAAYLSQANLPGKGSTRS